jgi:hypothetical protein
VPEEPRVPRSTWLWTVLIAVGFLIDKACFNDAAGQVTVGFKINLNDLFILLVLGLGAAVMLLYEIRETLRSIRDRIATAPPR